LLKKFVQLLIKLREYNNFDAMQAVLAGLSNSAVYRLKQTWAKVQKEKYWAQFEVRVSVESSLLLLFSSWIDLAYRALIF
jgi:hypothetical protein